MLFCISAVHIIFMFKIFVLIVCYVKHICMFSQFGIFLEIRMYENRLSLHTRSRAVQFEHTDNLLTCNVVNYIWLDLIQGACNQSPDSQVQEAPFPPMTLILITSKSLPPSSAGSIMVMAEHWFGWASPQGIFLDFALLSDKGQNVPSLPRYFWHKKASQPPTVRSGLDSRLTPSKAPSPLFVCLFFFRLPWLDHGRWPCSSKNLAGTV